MSPSTSISSPRFKDQVKYRTFAFLAFLFDRDRNHTTDFARFRTSVKYFLSSFLYKYACMTYANTTKFPPPLRLRSACDQHRCNPPRRPSQNYRSLSHHLAPFSHFAIAVYRLRHRHRTSTSHREHRSSKLSQVPRSVRRAHSTSQLPLIANQVVHRRYHSPSWTRGSP